ncbi:hypothetical protein DL93DRAFT_2088758 [Clavulina sp. PMI_390]|nr:hypothetical protein DL93DRAFT_2088758 [Clavulina sp. PMI_390]
MSASDPLTDWFVQHGGVFDRSAIGFQDFEPSEGGRGAVALKDLEVCHPVFSYIPTERKIRIGKLN